ncbi:MAG: hypothetical protein J7M39_00420, partial [Anaerolineae bacterium]|nr:hypothetical protein [Anaerolineae bacterium]
MPNTSLPVKTVLARALRALAHPVTVMCVLMLLLNDHVLRLQWPSWATGKLGDVAWLAFAPLVVALPLALLVPGLTPRRSRRAHSRITIGIALALVGALFAVVKALPVATAAFGRSFRALFGWSPRMVCDPTDLLALPALALPYWTWMRAGAPRTHRVRRTGKARTVKQWPHPRRRGWAVLALAALATLGNSGPPDEGIVCLRLDGERVLAGPQHGYAFTNTFASDDGGLTWTMIDEESASEPDILCEGRTDAWPVSTPDGTTLRYTPGRGIEASADGAGRGSGNTWTLELPLLGEEARLAYYQRARANYGAVMGPHDVIVDPATGNVIVAMGVEGVIVRTAPSAEDDTAAVWEWRAVGAYTYEPITEARQLFVILR